MAISCIHHPEHAIAPFAIPRAILSSRLQNDQPLRRMRSHVKSAAPAVDPPEPGGMHQRLPSLLRGTFPHGDGPAESVSAGVVDGDQVKLLGIHEDGMLDGVARQGGGVFSREGLGDDRLRGHGE